jgi:hypothetical protein
MGILLRNMEVSSFLVQRGKEKEDRGLIRRTTVSDTWYRDRYECDWRKLHAGTEH